MKGDAATGVSRARLAIKRSFRQGIVVTRSRFEWDADVPVLPIWLLLAGLKENAQRAAIFG